MPTIVHFDIPADNPERAKNFYTELFGWKFQRPMEKMEFFLFGTEDLDGKPGPRGGLGKRGTADQKIANYIGVSSIDEYLSKIERLGGKILMQKTAVSGWGYLAICADTEDNTFGLWEEDKKAKA